MSAYALGVDLGTTFSAASIAREATAQPLQLGTDAAQIPSVVVVREDGEVVVGDAAERRAAGEPTRVAREFKRRLGDPVPMVIGGVTYPIETMMGHLLRHIVQRATEQEGEAPAVVVLTHPANYGEYKTGVLREAARLAGLDPARVQLLTEPEAAAISYTRQQQIAPGEIVAVYDLGGGTFDAALVRRAKNRFELIGDPQGMERLGGIDFDQAVMAHVDTVLAGAVSGADRADPQTLPAQARLRTECRRAKETLSTDTDATISVSVPGLQTDVRLTRLEFEAMVRPRINETAQALERAIRSAGIAPADVSRVLLVGGSSRMPLVGELVQAATGRPVALDAHPKLAIATGAALFGAGSMPATGVGGGTPVAVPPGEWKPPVRQAVPKPPPTGSAKGKRKLGVMAAGAVVGVGAVIAITTLTGGDDDGASSTTAPAGAVTTAPTGDSSPTTEVTGGRGSTRLVTTVSLGEAGAAGPTALAVDSAGSVLVATPPGAVLRVQGEVVSTIGSLDPAEGVPGGIAVGPDGTVVVSAASGVWAFDDQGTPSLLLDASASGLGSIPGPLGFDGVGNLYVADNSNHRIIRRGTDGSLSLVAGDGSVPAAGAPQGDGQRGELVAVGTVTGLAIDRSGNLVFADDSIPALRQVGADGTMATLAGGGSTPLRAADGSIAADGTAAGSVSFAGIDAMSIDATGAAVVTDATSGVMVRITGGAIEVVIASNSSATPANGVPARESSVTRLGAVVVDRDGVVWFADAGALRSILAA